MTRQAVSTNGAPAADQAQVSFEFVAQRITEVPLLLLWGAVLLIVGHHARARQVQVPAPAKRTSSNAGGGGHPRRKSLKGSEEPENRRQQTEDPPGSDFPQVARLAEFKATPRGSAISVRSDEGTASGAVIASHGLSRNTNVDDGSRVPGAVGSRRPVETTRRQCSAHCKPRQKFFSAEHPSPCGSRFGDAGSLRSRPVSGQHRFRITACGSRMRREHALAAIVSHSSVESRGARETAGRNRLVIRGRRRWQGRGPHGSCRKRNLSQHSG